MLESPETMKLILLVTLVALCIAIVFILLLLISNRKKRLEHERVWRKGKKQAYDAFNDLWNERRKSFDNISADIDTVFKDVEVQVNNRMVELMKRVKETHDPTLYKLNTMFHPDNNAKVVNDNGNKQSDAQSSSNGNSWAESLEEFIRSQK